MNDGAVRSPFLVAGLGNPGREYRENRHNVGFMLLDRLAQTLGTSFTRRQFDALVATGEAGREKVILAKPQTMMNLSGRSVGALVRFFKLPLPRVLIVFDELDLPQGTLRIRPGGGNGGHRGLASVLSALGELDVPRLRIGIGRPPGRMDPADYVLQDFSEREMEVMGPALDRAVDCVRLYWSSGIAASMTECNGTVEAG